MTTILKYSNDNKELKILIIFAVITVLIPIFIFNIIPKWLPSDSDNKISVLELVLYYLFFDLFRWSIWKLAGGHKMIVSDIRIVEKS